MRIRIKISLLLCLLLCIPLVVPAQELTWGERRERRVQRAQSQTAANAWWRVQALRLVWAYDPYQCYALGLNYEMKRDSNILIVYSFPRRGDLCNIYSTGQQKKLFKRLCKEHGDVLTREQRDWYDFTRLNVPVSLYSRPNSIEWGRYTVDNFVRLNIVSNADWDERHEAGVPLNDIVMVEGITAYPYVTGDRDMVARNIALKDSMRFFDNNPYWRHGFFRKWASEVTPQDMILLGDDYLALCALDFVTPPTLTTEHRITVVMETDEGRIFTASMAMHFPLAQPGVRPGAHPVTQPVVHRAVNPDKE